MEEDRLLKLANAAHWLSELEKHNKDNTKKTFSALTIAESSSSSSSSLGSSLSSVENPTKIAKLAPSLSYQNDPNNDNSAGLWSTGFTKKKRTSVARRKIPVIDSLAALEERVRAGGGKELRLAVEKTLTVTDLSCNHARVSIPNGSLMSDFLTENEASLITGHEGLRVSVIDETDREYSLRLRLWSMGKSQRGIFILNGDWNSMAADNFLSPKDLIQLWSFRRSSQLCFAMVKGRSLTPARAEVD